MISLESKLISKLDIINTQSNIKKIDQTDTDSIEAVSVKQENTLGTIVISEKDNSLNDTSLPNSEYDQEENKLKKELSTMTPEEQMQLALDQMMKKNYSRSKEILEQFISNFPENQLSGSAHFWLGKIYLFETNYRKAAIVFGEGVQKFPKSIKAAEMYYEMAKSLKEMNKIPEACKTLVLLEENYQDSKFTKDPEKITNNLDCAVNN